MTIEQLRRRGNIEFYGNTYKNPFDFFIGLGDTIELIKGNSARFLIKKRITQRSNDILYMNIVYAVDLTNPIYKIYFSINHNGIEFVSKRIYIANNITIDGCFDLSTISIPSIDLILSDIECYNSITIDKTRFEKLIGIGCTHAINMTINKRGHLSKLSPSLFINIAKYFKKNETINIESIIILAFNEIETNEIISVYEKKLIFQEILDKFILN